MDSALFDIDPATLRNTLEQHRANGVRIPCSDGIIITEDVTIGAGAVILPGCILSGATAIGTDCVIGPNSVLSDTIVGGGVTLNNVHSEDASVGDGCTIGPWVRLRPGTELGCGLRIGNFVELKNAQIGSNTCIAHLSYLGDCTFGEHVNVGCGLAVANYDGQKKHRTTVGDDVFLGCHNVLVSPVNVGAGAYTAAGSVITDDVPAGGFTIARSRQINKEPRKKS